MSLRNKTLFITGASRGIGLAIALRAARDGANIAIAAKTMTPHPKLEGTIYTAAEQIEKAGGRALPLIVDVRDEQAVHAAIEQAAAAFGQPGAGGLASSALVPQPSASKGGLKNALLKMGLAAAPFVAGGFKNISPETMKLIQAGSQAGTAALGFQTPLSRPVAPQTMWVSGI